jgi:hypothetical protein
MTDMNWRDLLAGMALIGLLASGERGRLGHNAYEYADDLLSARDEIDAGIVSVKKRKSRVQKQEAA